MAGLSQQAVDAFSNNATESDQAGHLSSFEITAWGSRPGLGPHCSFGNTGFCVPTSFILGKEARKKIKPLGLLTAMSTERSGPRVAGVSGADHLWEAT